MKGEVFCLSNSSLEGIYMIGSTAFPLETLLKEISDKNINTPFKKEYSIESYSILSTERCIRKILKDYSYEKKKRFFKINLETIIKIFEDINKTDELEKDKEKLRLQKEKIKIDICVKFINEKFEPLENNNNEILEPGDSRSIKIGTIHDMYVLWCKKENITPDKRVGICDFQKICENHTFLKKLSTYCEFNFVKLKT
jgi:hypothetical protein